MKSNPCLKPPLCNKTNNILMPGQRPVNFGVTVAEAGRRLDVIFAARFPEISRNTARQLIQKGHVRVGGKICKPSYKPCAEELITGTLPDAGTSGAPHADAFPPDTIAPDAIPPDAIPPDAIPIDILFEDNHLLALNKPPGLVVHPAAGHGRHTLANALIHHRPEIAGIGSGPDRPGIVHRLDKLTSGAILVAKTHASFEGLSAQFRERRIEKTYLGLVYGEPKAESGRIDLPIGRHLTQRKKMSATHYSRARHAETHWQVKRRYGKLTLMAYTITTGRTHQIRVHSAAIHCPLVGDSVYGIKKPARYLSDQPNLLALVRSINRQMLHAWRLRFAHPLTETPLYIEAPLPPDMADLLLHLDTP